ncbi:hypothetical protein CCACVL1_19546 [Corchorus capsularis]|uniref:Uncharacterized protein n=1 Tax=Corchorus capsularis TaxID=210143 RepID=A0A1R3HGH1_COCAP|nr:hypothetical protein CCACVL1_19546 [Corchorus capsularis]
MVTRIATRPRGGDLAAYPIWLQPSDRNRESD